MRYDDQVDILADHSALLAIPAFVPAFAVVAVVLFIAVRDRRAERREAAGEESSQLPVKEEN